MFVIFFFFQLARIMLGVGFFITATCNPKWEEITRHLLPGQNASDQPVLTARVFQKKLQALIKLLKSDNSPLGRACYLVYTIEYQQRGPQ